MIDFFENGRDENLKLKGKNRSRKVDWITDQEGYLNDQDQKQTFLVDMHLKFSAQKNVE